MSKATTKNEFVIFSLVSGNVNNYLLCYLKIPKGLLLWMLLHTIRLLDPFLKAVSVRDQDIP